MNLEDSRRRAGVFGDARQAAPSFAARSGGGFNGSFRGGHRGCFHGGRLVWLYATCGVPLTGPRVWAWA